MARKLKNVGFVTMAQFARKLGVSGPAVGKAVQSGRLVAYDGHGDRVPPGFRARKWLKEAEAREDWHHRRVRIDGGAAASDGADLVAARTRTSNLQAELLEIRLAREQGELIPRAAAIAASESMGRAVGRALDGMLALTEGIVTAGQSGGLQAASALFREEIRKAREDIANMLLAEVAELEERPPDRGHED